MGEEMFSEFSALERNDEDVPVHATKVYRDRSRVTPLILYLNNSYKGVLNITPWPLYIR
jgi:hypothetical protein